MAQSDGVDIPGNHDLSADERRLRIERCHRPYYQALFQKIAQLQAQKITPIIFSIHGFTPQLKGGAFRPWHAGVLYVKENPFALHLLQHLKQFPFLNVDANVPYDMRRYNTGAAAICGEDNGLQNAVIEIRDSEFVNIAAGTQKWAEILLPLLSLR